MRLTQIIEALLFASDAPLTAGDLARVDERLDEDTVEAVVQELRSEYDLSERSFQIYEVAGGYQLLTRPEFVSVLDRFETVPQTARLSGSALEVLSVVAYRQPLGRTEIEEIRGVGSSGVIRTLLDRELITVVGRSEGLGRPLLYGTTQKFLEHFGFRSIEDLPRPEELPVVLRTRGLGEQIATAAAEDTAPENAAEPALADEMQTTPENAGVAIDPGEEGTGVEPQSDAEAPEPEPEPDAVDDRATDTDVDADLEREPAPTPAHGRSD